MASLDCGRESCPQLHPVAPDQWCRACLLRVVQRAQEAVELSALARAEAVTRYRLLGDDDASWFIEQDLEDIDWREVSTGYFSPRDTP